jgi:hypothetical protein
VRKYRIFFRDSFPLGAKLYTAAPIPSLFPPSLTGTGGYGASVSLQMETQMLK